PRPCRPCRRSSPSGSPTPSKPNAPPPPQPTGTSSPAPPTGRCATCSATPSPCPPSGAVPDGQAPPRALAHRLVVPDSGWRGLGLPDTLGCLAGGKAVRPQGRRVMTLDKLEAIIWSQARHLTSTDPLQRQTAMDAIRVAIQGYADHAAGP